MAYPIHYRRLLTQLNGASGSPLRIGIYGAGKIGQELYKVFHDNDISVYCYIDKNAATLGSFADQHVYSPEDIHTLELDVVVIASVAFFYEIKQQLESLGLSLTIYGLLGEDVVRSKLAESNIATVDYLFEYPDVADVWQELIKSDAKNADVYRECISRLLDSN